MPQGPSAGRVRRLEQMNQDKFDQDRLERDQRRQLHVASRQLTQAGLTGGAGPGVTKAALRSGRPLNQALPQIQQQQNRADLQLLGASEVADNVTNQQKANAAKIKGEIGIAPGLQQPSSPSAPSVSDGPFNPFSGKLEKMFKGVQSPETRQQLVKRLESLVSSGVPVNQALQEVQREVGKFADHEQRQQLSQAAGSLLPGAAGGAVNAGTDIMNRLSQANLPQPVAPITGQQSNMQQAAAAPIIDQFQRDRDDSFLREETFAQTQDRRRAELFEDSERGVLDSASDLNRGRADLARSQGDALKRGAETDSFRADTERETARALAQNDRARIEVQKFSAETEKFVAESNKAISDRSLDLQERTIKTQKSLEKARIKMGNKSLDQAFELDSRKLDQMDENARNQFEIQKRQLDDHLKIAMKQLDVAEKDSENRKIVGLSQAYAQAAAATAPVMGKILADVADKYEAAVKATEKKFLEMGDVETTDLLEGELRDQYLAEKESHNAILVGGSRAWAAILARLGDINAQIQSLQGGAGGGQAAPHIDQNPLGQQVNEVESRRGSQNNAGQPIINPASGNADFSQGDLFPDLPEVGSLEKDERGRTTVLRAKSGRIYDLKRSVRGDRWVLREGN